MCEQDKVSSFAALVRTIVLLRGPQGCPWDRQQTHNSLKPHLIEECYEVLEALDDGDSKKLCEELGDVLLQVVLHAQIAEEENEFHIGDVAEAINSKLIHRHPHVFGEEQAESAEEVALKWDALKQKEKGNNSVLGGLPKGMPSLAYSQAIQRRAARVGFDWKEEEEIIEKVAEEARELQQAVDDEAAEEEFGDLLFTLANVARRRGIDLETALHRANNKFRQRFSYMEELSRQHGVAFASLSLKEQDMLWNKAKQALLHGRGERI